MKPPLTTFGTLVKYTLSALDAVGKNVKEKLPALFAFVCDGWSNKSTHLIAKFSSFSAQYKNNQDQTLLSLFTLKDEIV